MLGRKWQGRSNVELKDEIIILYPYKDNNYSIFYGYLIVFAIVFVFLLSGDKQSINNPADVPEQVRTHGYNYEIHNVTTKDGQVLEIERIHKKSPDVGRKKVLLLGHDMSQVGGPGICKGPHQSLGYNLADEDYDVWLLNVRGNSISTHYTTMSSASKEYWAHSWNEMGIYDLPSTIEYILQTTQVQQIDYVGFSKMNTIYFVLLRGNPSDAKKVRRFAALAPAVFGTNLAYPYPPLYYYFSALQVISAKVCK